MNTNNTFINYSTEVKESLKYLKLVILLISLMCFSKEIFSQVSGISSDKVISTKENTLILFNTGKKYYDSGDYATAFDYAKKSANMGYASAQCLLAVMYHEGRGVEKNMEQAAYWAMKAAEQGDMKAQFFLADLFENGDGITKDPKRAIFWYKKSADQGFASAQYHLAYIYDLGTDVAQDRTQAAFWYQKVAEQGDALAQARLALMYDRGDGVSKDIDRAINWYRKAAEQGEANAQYRLGMKYDSGDGISKDLKQATYWFQKAAKQGYAKAQFQLALMYEDGEGVGENKELAVYWCRKAAEQEYADAQVKLGSMYMIGYWVDKDFKEAISWYKKAADRGNALGQLSVGYMYARGNGVLKNEIEGLAWYYLARSNGERKLTVDLISNLERELGKNGVFKAQQREKEIENRINVQSSNIGSQAQGVNANESERSASAQNFQSSTPQSPKGDSEAQFDIGMKYFKSGEKIKAFEYFKKSAEQGFVKSQMTLALMYYDIEDGDKDMMQAIYWYKKAAGQGEVVAQLRLAIIYDLGEGVAKDTGQAAYWYKKAAEQGDAIAQFRVGVMYHSGESVSFDPKQAAYWYQKAAVQGNAMAQFRLAEMYRIGEGVTKDIEQAVVWYKKAADSGYKPAQDYIEDTTNKDDMVTTYENLKKLAGQGKAEAQYALGIMYYFGDGVPKDFAQAAYWYRKAAEQEYAMAQFRLAIMYTRAEGVKKDIGQSVYWLRKAAEQGLGKAQLIMGLTYASGIDVPKDELEGLAWLYLARSNGQEKLAADRISIVERELGKDGSLAAQQRSKEIAKRINVQISNNNSQNPSTSVNAISSASMEMLNNGSGVFISQDGLILTAAHVIAGASSIKVLTQQGLLLATVVQVDATNDVALLRCKGQFTVARVANSKDVRLGRSIFTIGFPQVDLQGFSPKLTKGEISSLAGMHDDPRHWQISAPIQPGNSGGPLFDNNGDVIGIIVSKLDEIAVAAQTGSLSQNVNYALKSAYIRPLLEEQNIPINDPKDAQSPRLEDIAERVQKSIVLIITYGER